MKSLTHFAAIALTLLSGCASVVPLDDVPDPSGAALDRSISAPYLERTKNADMQAVPAQLHGSINIHGYAGEAKHILQRMAVAHSKSFSVKGPRPHMQLFVMVDAKGATLESVLSDIGAQLGQRADVVLTSTSIEVHYRD